MTAKKNKIAFITGITGQDGSYLAELLLAKGYEIHGLIRRSSTESSSRINHLIEASNPLIKLHYGDLSDGQSLTNLLLDIKPDEVYNLAAQSHVRISFDKPLYTNDITGTGVLRMLEAVRMLCKEKEVRFYQASSSEMFGDVFESPQTELTQFRPRSPYGCSKVYAHFQTVNYREAYDMYACSGILFNHESPRRGENFVTRKITLAANHIAAGLQDKLFLGNLDARRDWGYAPDYVEAMWLILQQDKPDDFVIATNETHSIREFLDIAFGLLNLNWENHVEIDPTFFRPTEVNLLIGDYSKAKNQLQWKPSTSFEELIRIMINGDKKIVAQNQDQGQFNSSFE